jgi:putative tricarboxylic transport membrane protein
MKDRESVSAVFVILFAILFCYWSSRLSLWSGDGPGDGLFPFLAGLALGFFGLLLLIQRLLSPQAEQKMVGIRKIKLTIYIGSLIAYTLLFEPLGFIPTSFLFMLAICKGAERAGWKTSLTISGLSTALSFIVFHLLDVPFPLGVLKVFSFLWGS